MAIFDIVVNNGWNICITLFVSFLVYTWMTRKTNLPPGPKGSFIFGVMNEMQNIFQSMQLFKQMAQEYGDIVSCYLGRRRLIVLNSYDAIKEAFLSRGDEFSDRMLTGLEFVDFRDALFVASYNRKWKETKKFAVQALKNSGFGTPKSEQKITNEIAAFLKYLDEQDGCPMEPKLPLQNLTSNSLISVLVNKRYPWGSNDLKRVVTVTEEFLGALGSAQGLFFINQYIPAFIMKFFWGSRIQECLIKSGNLKSFLKDQIAEHRATIDSNHTRDFLDFYLRDGKDKEMDENIFVNTMCIFFPDGCGTTADAINWAVLHLAHNPEVQEKAQEQIEEICGSRIPTLADRKCLTYIEAIMTEAFRLGTPASTTAEHRVSKETTLRGYTIPKENTAIIANLHHCHRDPTTFPEPDKFKPSRFIDEDGKLVNTDHVIPFGIGPRMCMGAQYVKALFFLTVSHLLQRFTLRFPVDQPNPTLEPDNFLITRPQPYKVCAQQRK